MDEMAIDSAGYSDMNNMDQIAHDLTKATLAEHLFQQLGLNVREAKDLVEIYMLPACFSLQKITNNPNDTLGTTTNKEDRLPT
ncbi:hypothetical protein CCP4SC76_8060003 [Gammaproteobacteria bacterium]